MVSTASKKLKSLFDTYTIKDVDERNYPQISEVLSNAVKRSYGPEVRLDLQLDSYSVSPTQIKEILTSYKESIVSLNLGDPEILLQPHLEFTNIQRLDISFQQIFSFHCDEGLHKNICEAILARYGDKLEHLGVKYLELPNNTVLQVPHLSKLKSLALDCVDNNIVHTFVNSVNNENITHLSLCWIRLDIEQFDNFIFPKLQNLELVGIEISGESVLALIKYNKDTITKLKVTNVYFRDRDIGDIKIPNLQYLELYFTTGDVALSLIKNNNDTLCEIRLNIFDFRNTSLPVVEMPRLRRLYLKNGDATSELKVIKAFGRNIEELWSFDKQKFTYIRISREELNNLKLKALALQ